MDKKQENEAWFDRWSESYDRFIFKRWMWFWQDKTIAEIPKRSKSILEVACGTGVGTEKAARLFSRAQIVAVDLSDGMVRKARARLSQFKKVLVRRGDVERLSFRQQFDAVFCTESFHHFPNPPKAVREMARVTKKGGFIAITDINVRPYFLTNILFRLEPGFVGMYSRKEFAQLFERAGVTVFKQKRVGLFALMTVGQKK